jgi:RNA polymerase sigma-70 factor (ECF subfamily)
VFYSLRGFAHRKKGERLASPADSDKDKLLAEEHRLIRTAQQGDRCAFARLAEDYYDRLYRWLYHLSRDRHAAEDLTQETLLKAFTNLTKFRAGSNFRAWLFRIAHNNFINQRRAASRQREALPENLPDDEDGPPEQTVQNEERTLLAAAVTKLPPDFRAAFLLRVEEGLSFRQIAGILELTEETARWRVFKARQKLLSALSPPNSKVQQEKP